MRTSFRLSTAITLAGGLAVGTLAVASPAQAASGSFSGGVLAISFSQPDNIRVEEAYDAPGVYRVISYLDAISVSGCTAVASYFECTGVTKVVMTGSSGNDTLQVSGPVSAELRGGSGADELVADGVMAASLYGEAGDDELYVTTMAPAATAGATVDGGDGNDSVGGSPLDDTIHGGPGNDQLAGYGGDDVIFGGAGDDVLLGDSATGLTFPDDGDDTLHGGEGNDVFHGQGGADAFHGGPGVDTADYFQQYSGQSGVNLRASLDGVANDGAAREGDNVDADGSVENIKAGDLNFTLDSVVLIGDNGPNHLKGYSPKSITADGRGGNDLIEVSSMQSGGKTTVQGGAGNDTITSSGATSTVDGGPGNDIIYSGRGHDTVTGGPGRDTIDTGYGNDTINTRDGEVDSVSCGVGADTLIGDKLDVVNADPLALCESQDLKDVRAPGPRTGKGTFTAKVPNRTKVSRTGVVKFRVANGFNKPVTVAVVIKAKKPQLIVGKTKARVGANAGRTVKVKLTSKAVKLLKRQKTIKVTVTFTGIKGAKGTFSLKRQTVLRR